MLDQKSTCKQHPNQGTTNLDTQLEQQPHQGTSKNSPTTTARANLVYKQRSSTEDVTYLGNKCLQKTNQDSGRIARGYGCPKHSFKHMLVKTVVWN